MALHCSCHTPVSQSELCTQAVVAGIPSVLQPELCAQAVGVSDSAETVKHQFIDCYGLVVGAALAPVAPVSRAAVGCALLPGPGTSLPDLEVGTHASTAQLLIRLQTQTV